MLSLFFKVDIRNATNFKTYSNQFMARSLRIDRVSVPFTLNIANAPTRCNQPKFFSSASELTLINIRNARKHFEKLEKVDRGRLEAGRHW